MVFGRARLHGIMKIRYDITPAERVRVILGITPREFSHRLGYAERAYEFAHQRGYLTYRMVREISLRFKVPLSDFKRLNAEGVQT